MGFGQQYWEKVETVSKRFHFPLENVHAKSYMVSFLTIKNKTSRHKIKRYAETGSPWPAPFSRLKYEVAVPPLIIQDSWLSISILTYLIKSWPNPNFLGQASKKEWLKESNAFSMSKVTIYPFKLKIVLISNISDKSLSLSPMNLFLTYAACWHDIKSGKVSFNLVARAFYLFKLCTFAP